MAAKFYHVLVGSEIGLLKGINVTQNKWDNLTELSSVDRTNEICVMCWENRQQEDRVLFGTRGGLVKTYSQDLHTGQDVLQVTDSDDQIIRGLYKLDSKYVTCTNKGKLCVWQDLENDAEPIVIDCGDNISCMREDPTNPTRVSTGGKENCLKIYDLTRPEVGVVFKAKNVRDDWLDLTVPIWVTDIGYMPKATSSLVVTTTGYHQIRVYDPSISQRRPVIDMEWEEQPITSLCINPQNDRQMMVGNTVGEQALIDVRNKKSLGKFKGGAGAIRSLQCHPTLPLVASCGLDRYVRIHDMSTRVLLHKFYMKARLNTLLLSTKWEDESVIGEPEDSEVLVELKQEVPEEEAEESDALWESLDVIAEEKKRSKGNKSMSDVISNGKVSKLDMESAKKSSKKLKKKRKQT